VFKSILMSEIGSDDLYVKIISFQIFMKYNMLTKW